MSASDGDTTQARNPGAPVMALWAKLRKEEGQEGAYHPLIYHLLDVAACAEALWEHVLTPQARDSIAQWIGLPTDDARRWIAFLAGIHDIGKASPAFFQQDPDGAARLRAAGCDPGSLVEKDPHGTISTSALLEILPDLGIASGLALRLAALIGGHHGQIPSDHAVENLHDRAIGGESTPWPVLRRALADTLARALDLPTDSKPQQLGNAAAFWLAGLVSVADWIGSNQTYFGFAAQDALRPPNFDPAYLSHARAQALAALRELGWLAQPPVAGEFTFRDVFGFEPNDMQSAVVDLGSKLDQQGIVIVEAPMGQGKTEAALWLADTWRTRLGQRGFYVALPTQATSNQMFGRVTDFILNRYPDGVSNIQLLHGHASLSAQFQDLRQTGYRLFRPAAVGEHSGDQDSSGAVAAAEWFTYRKRGLLAPFGVGTVDQALLAALQTRHVFVRLFGLAHKTVIVDEVHAYDLYMSTLLDRLLEWLAALGSCVVLLSATLPNSRRKQLTQAYGRGLRTHIDIPEAPYPRVTWLGGNESEAIAIRPGEPKTIDLLWMDGDIPEGGVNKFPLGEALREALAAGGTAAVICNTVRRAQEVFNALKSYFPEIATDLRPELDLLHARFIHEDREQRERRTLLRFGKQGAQVRTEAGPEAVSRPYRAVLVATQIVEQSLDLDFDLMVTDLAPADLVLQRSGRLWRHERGLRPRRSPELWIARPPIDDHGLPQFDRGSQYVYFPHILLRSWLALRHRDSITLPTDMAEIVEGVYAEDQDATNLSPELQRLWHTTLHSQREEVDHEEWEALKRLIGTTSSRKNLDELQAAALDEDRPEVHPARQAMTRLADPSVQVVLLERRNGDVVLPDGTVIDLDQEPRGPVVKALLNRSLSIGDRRVLFSLVAADPPSGWAKSPLLRNHRLVELSRDGRSEIGEYTLILEPELGLIIQKGE